MQADIVDEEIKRRCDEIRANIELMAENILDLIRLKFKNLREELN